MSSVLRRLSVPEFHFLAPELVDLYLDAMGYPAAMRLQRIKVWRRECAYPGFSSVIATESEGGAEYITGLAYGFSANSRTWWHQQVAHGVQPRGRLDILDDYFELAEIHVDRRRQGRGIGRRLATELLAHQPHRRVLLSTPEVEGEANAAFHLYRNLGFYDVLRNFRFDGDARPFAVLGAELPLS